MGIQDLDKIMRIGKEDKESKVLAQLQLILIYIYRPHGGSSEEVYGGNTQAYTDHFSGNMRDKYAAADAEHQNHINGNYAYDNKRGWYLKNK